MATTNIDESFLNPDTSYYFGDPTGSNVLDAEIGNAFGSVTPQPYSGTSDSGSSGGDVVKQYTTSDGKYTYTDVNKYNDYEAKLAADKAAQAKTTTDRISAWTVLDDLFGQWGLGSIAGPLQQMFIDGASADEIKLRLRQTPEYQQRFSANADRIKAGLRPLSEAEYIYLEDQYTNVMRRYGLPDWFTQVGTNGSQAGLNQFIANDVSPAELEDRVQLAVNRLQNGPQEVMTALRNFYPDITSGDMLAYILDPKKSLPVLQRMVTMAEIGGEAMRYGLNADKSRAEELATLGVDQATARKGYETIGSGLDRGSTLGALYGENYDQNTAEQEVFGLNDSANAGRKRRKIIGMETANFSGSTGVRGGALDANRAGAF